MMIAPVVPVPPMFLPAGQPGPNRHILRPQSPRLVTEFGLLVFRVTPLLWAPGEDFSETLNSTTVGY